MRCKSALICLVFCCALCGCDSSEPLILSSSEQSDASNTLENQGTEESSGVEESSSTGEKQKAEELLPDWSNWMSGTLAYPSLAANLLIDKDGTVMMESNAEAVDGTLSLYLDYYLSLDDDCIYESDATVFTLVSVNGTLCNFVLNEEQSQDGILVSQRPVGEEFCEPLVISDCNLLEGENSISVFTAAYFPQVGHVINGKLTRTFFSDTAQTQGQTYTLDVAELSGVEYVKTDQVDEKLVNTLLNESPDFVYDQISFEESKRCTTIASDGISGYHLSNNVGYTATPAAGARSCICIVLKNGELIPAWNGATLLQIPFTKDDISVTLPISCELEEGEYSHMSFFTFNLNFDSEMGCTWYERLFYVDGSVST